MLFILVRVKADFGLMLFILVCVKQASAQARPTGDTMAPKKHKKSRSCSGPRAWNDSGDTQREAGAELMKCFLELWAFGKINSTDLTALCWWADKAEVPGADFKSLAYNPAKAETASGNPSRLVDSVLPPGGEFYMCEVPVNPLNRAVRETAKFPIRVLWSSLETEYRRCPCQLDLLDLAAAGKKTNTVLDTPVYQEHPQVILARSEGRRLPVPLALYLDGVVVIQQAAGKQESVQGVVDPLLRDGWLVRAA